MKWFKGIIIILLVLVLGFMALSYFSPGTVTGILVKLQRNSAGLTLKEISADGYKFIYLENNPGSEETPTIVLLHGFAADKNWMVPMAKYLREYHVVIPDLPGFGESEQNQSLKYDISSQVDRIFRFTEKIGLKKFYIAGNSMGGNIAGVFSARYPDKVLGLIFINNAGVTMPVKSEFVKMIESGTNPLVIRDKNEFERVIDMIYFKKPHIPYAVKSVMIKRAIANGPFFKKISVECLKNTATEDVLGKLTMPVLIIWGDKDKFCDISIVRVLEKRLANYTTKILKDCGHVPMMERPGETAGYIISFIRQRK